MPASDSRNSFSLKGSCQSSSEVKGKLMNKPSRFPHDKPSPLSAQEQIRKQQQSQLHVMQPKMAAAPQKMPVAPPVYRPQPTPRVLQRKTAVQPPVVQAKPAAPPAYRPQPTPKVLQTKGAGSRPSLHVGKLTRQPVVPPTYRLEPKPLQSKPAPIAQAALQMKPNAPPAVARPMAPHGAAASSKDQFPRQAPVVQLKTPTGLPTNHRVSKTPTRSIIRNRVGPNTPAASCNRQRPSPVALQSGCAKAVVQRMSMADVDEDVLYDMLRNDLKGDKTIKMLTRVNKYFCTGMTYLGVQDPNTGGITFPHEPTPMVVINLTPHRDTEHLAHTIYHELRHAFDATPHRTLNTPQAKSVDLHNEARTWHKEMKFSIRKGGTEFQNNLANGLITGTGTPQDPYLPLPVNQLLGFLQKDYAQYLLDSRPARFDPTNYVFAGKQAFETPTSPEWRDRENDLEWMQMWNATLEALRNQQ